jgi:hypothetical protein
MAILVYIICALTSCGCAALLLRAYVRSRFNLLLWSFFCFVCIGLNNTVLVLDGLLGPEYDFSLIRGGLSAAGSFILLFALVWNTV